MANLPPNISDRCSFLGSYQLPVVYLSSLLSALTPIIKILIIFLHLTVQCPMLSPIGKIIGSYTTSLEQKNDMIKASLQLTFTAYKLFLICYIHYSRMKKIFKNIILIMIIPILILRLLMESFKTNLYPPLPYDFEIHCIILFYK